MAKEVEPVEVTSLINKLFLGEFYEERSVYADVASTHIRCAGKPSRANPNAEDEGWWMKHGPEMLQRWQNWRDRSDWMIWVTPDGTPAIELELFIPLGGIPVKMIIDRVFQTSTGKLIVLDLKSGSRDPASDLQLGFYRAGISAQFGVDVYGGTYWMAREGTCTDIVSLNRYTPSLLAHYVKQFQTAREQGIYMPHVTNMCRACGVNRYCLAYGGSQAHMDPDWDYAMEGSGFMQPEEEEEGLANDCSS